MLINNIRYNKDKINLNDLNILTKYFEKKEKKVKNIYNRLNL